MFYFKYFPSLKWAFLKEMDKNDNFLEVKFCIFWMKPIIKAEIGSIKLHTGSKICEWLSVIKNLNVSQKLDDIYLSIKPLFNLNLNHCSRSQSFDD